MSHTHIHTISPVVTDLAANTPEAKYARDVLTAACYINATRSLNEAIGVLHDKTIGGMVGSTLRTAIETGRALGKDDEDVRTDVNKQAFLLLTKKIAEYNSHIE